MQPQLSGHLRTPPDDRCFFYCFVYDSAPDAYLACAQNDAGFFLETEDAKRFATIDVEKFSAHFNKAPIIQVSGRTFPVDIIYRPLKQLSQDVVENIEDAVLSSINDLHPRPGPGVFTLLAGPRSRPGEPHVAGLERS